MGTFVLADILPFLAVVTVAGLIHGTFGLGFPMVATPPIALMTDVKTAILLTLAPNIAVNIYSMLRGGDWSSSLGRYWPVAFWILLGSALGTVWLVSVDPNPFRLLLAAALVLYLLRDRFQALDAWGWIRKREKLAGAGMGLTAGILGGTVNVTGPVVMIYFMELRVAPLVLVQAINLCFLVGKTTQAVTFAVLGLFGSTLLLLSLPLGVMALIGLRTGMALRDRVSVEVFRGWLRGLLWVMAGMLIVQFLLEMLEV